MDLDAIARQLTYFEPKPVNLNPPAQAEAISLAEQRLGLAFPPSIRRFLTRHNGGWIADLRLLGVPPTQSNLDLVADVELRRSLFGSIWPGSYLTVSTDGAGCPYVVATDRLDERGESPVILVDCISPEQTTLVASNYLAFLWFAIGDQIRVLKPDGTYRSDSELGQLEPDWLTRWYHREDFLLAHDPDVVRWRSVFELGPGKP